MAALTSPTRNDHAVHVHNEDGHPPTERWLKKSSKMLSARKAQKHAQIERMQKAIEADLGLAIHNAKKLR
jgi:hypothetical protein